jgi:hypothetical protein
MNHARNKYKPLQMRSVPEGGGSGRFLKIRESRRTKAQRVP